MRDRRRVGVRARLLAGSGALSRATPRRAPTWRYPRTIPEKTMPRRAGCPTHYGSTPADSATETLAGRFEPHAELDGGLLQSAAALQSTASGASCCPTCASRRSRWADARARLRSRSDSAAVCAPCHTHTLLTPGLTRGLLHLCPVPPIQGPVEARPPSSTTVAATRSHFQIARAALRPTAERRYSTAAARPRTRYH